MKYRAEIDGLRAVAVIPVIFFHAGFNLFSGGFVGVDVFFVISGYLITTILIEDIESGSFSIARFYERRARRLLPALFLVILFCVPLAWASMFPRQMEDFSQSLIAVSLFVSNILFWQESGYFAAAAEEKPLLHTWSLAVEEQFYIIFPVFLFVFWRFGKFKLFILILLIFFASFALSEWGWRNRSRANFYLAPTRAWELLAGSLAAFVVHKRGVGSSNLLSLLGLLAIVISIFAYTEATPFPSFYALIPVLGVVALILWADENTIAAKILSVRALVFIGLISYSAYLWHQPLFSFARLRSIQELQTYIYYVLILINFVLAYLSWRFVESPFRDKEKYKRIYIFKFSLYGLLTYIFLGISLIIINGKNKDDLLEYRELEYQTHWDGWEDCEIDLFVIDKRSGCKILNPEMPVGYIVIGDSHAGHLANGIRNLAAKLNQNFMIVFSAGCYPGIGRKGGLFDCRDDHIMKAVRMAVNTSTVKGVVLSGYGINKLNGDRFTDKDKIEVEQTRVDEFKLGLENVVQILFDAGKRVVIVADNPEMPTKTPGKCLLLNNCSKLRVLRGEYEVRSQRYNTVIEDIRYKFDELLVLYPHNVLCDNEWCYGTNNDTLLYQSDDHLTPAGSLFVVENLFDEFLVGKL